jgi:hypothetical protein
MNAGVVCLAHRERELRLPLGVEVAELAVLIRSALVSCCRRRFLILEAQELERDARATKLSMNPLEVDRNASERLIGAELLEQARLDVCVAQAPRDVPRDPGIRRPLQIVRDGPLREASRRLDLPLRAAALEL